MKKIFRLFAALCLASFALACGGTAEELDGENLDDVKPSASEPITWVAMARKAAETYTKGGEQLMHIDGNIGRTDGFDWTFTFANFSNGNWATVLCDGRTAKVVEHHHQSGISLGSAVIDMAKVRVTTEKLLAIGAKHHLSGRVLSIDLSEALTVDLHPHWYLRQGTKEIAVDAYNGAVLR